MFHAIARNALHFGLATGIFNSGTSVGEVLALLIVPWVLRNYSWHEVFWITGAFGFI